MPFWGRLNRALASVFGASMVSESAIQRIEAKSETLVVTLGDVSNALDDMKTRLAALSGKLDVLTARSETTFPLDPMERAYIERYRSDQILLASWQGPEREQLVGRIQAILKKLRPFKALAHEKARFGSANDGGYVLLDDFNQTPAALSFGVERNAEFDLALANRGVRVLQFDHTIDSSPADHPLIAWEKKKIAPTASEDTESIVSLVGQCDIADGPPGMILKMDIEHDEWTVLDATPAETLARFAQITAEFHGFDFLAEHSYLERVERVVEKLNRQFAVIHVHANNYCGIANYFGLTVPYILEITFVNRSRYPVSDVEEVFPGDLDAPCDKDRPDIVLGAFRY